MCLGLRLQIPHEPPVTSGSKGLSCDASDCGYGGADGHQALTSLLVPMTGPVAL